MVFLESIAGGAAAPVLPDVDERAARRTLRAQIARLERDLGAALIAAYPRLPAAPRASPPRPAPARARASSSASATTSPIASRRSARRPRPRPSARRKRALLIERMLLDPGAYSWVRVANEDIGQPGCKHWHVRPRLGVIGMLAGWWHVKISSGCPLAP